MLSINTNLSSLIAQNSMKTSTSKLNQAIERMTTGFKINHASDNAANYSISTNMTTKIGAYNVAEDNAAMGLDMIATAEGTLNQIQDKLERLRALAEQASNGTYGEQSKQAINAEANALVDEINRLYETAEYNGIKLFNPVLNTETQTSTTISVYEQYQDSQIIWNSPVSTIPPMSHLTVSFSDGTQLYFNSFQTAKSLTYGELTIPESYTWSEDFGCFLDSAQNQVALVIEFIAGDQAWRIYTETLNIYGIEISSEVPVENINSNSVNNLLALQIGASSDWASQVGVSTVFELEGVDDLRNIGLDLITDYLSKIDEMLNQVSEKQTQFGAVSNRLESVLEEITIQRDNLVSSRSTIRDADIAEVSASYIQQQILQQASATLLATANQSPSIALQLI